MALPTQLRAAASSFGGEALEDWAIQRASRKWGIYVRDPDIATKGLRAGLARTFGDGIGTAFTTLPERVLSAAHISSLKIEEQADIATAPQEDGQFTSYNKVAHPLKATIRMICDGSETGNLGENLLPGFIRGAIGVGPDTVRKNFLNTLANIVKDTNIYFIATPEHTYKYANITGYSFTRESTNGAEIIIADITVQEVRQAPSTALNTGRYPWNQKTKDNGTVNLQPVSRK